MAQPYLIAMEHAEWQARNTLHRLAQKRPLGSIEAQHRFTPRAPVLSSRTVDIDVSGTRTYRAKSTGDIIEEQHRIIHNVYKSARNTASAPPRKQNRNVGSVEQDVKVLSLKFLTVDGINRGSNRPATSLGYHHNRKVHHKRRPHTTGSRPKHPTTNTHLHIEEDPEIQASTELVNEAHRRVREQWLPDRHTLDEGKFQRGRKDIPITSLDPKTGNQWLSFAGTQTADRVGGLVQAFADPRNEEDMYTIDGSTGVQVARQLKKGDKIRVGINGRIQSHDLRIRNKNSARSVRSEPPPKYPVPLCWTDQVGRPDTKVISASEPVEEKPKPNLNETHPVVYDKLLQEEAFWDYKPKSPPTGGSLIKADSVGYKVKLRNKKRTGIDGQESPGMITALTIDPNSDVEDDPDQMTLEEVLETRLMPRCSPDSDQGLSLRTDANMTVINDHPPSEAPSYDSRSPSKNRNTDTMSVLSEPRASIPSKSPQGNYTLQTEAEWQSFMVTNVSSNPPSVKGESRVGSVKGDSSRAGSRAGSRAASAKRPISRGGLHKTNAAQGASISSHHGNRGGDAAYIQIAQGLQPSKEPIPKVISPRATTPAVVHASAIRSVHDTNKLEYSSHDGEASDMKLTGRGAATVNKVHSTPAPANSPPTSPEPSPQPADVKIAFNIPTADNLDFFEAESFIEPSEHSNNAINSRTSSRGADNRDNAMSPEVPPSGDPAVGQLADEDDNPSVNVSTETKEVERLREDLQSGLKAS